MRSKIKPHRLFNANTAISPYRSGGNHESDNSIPINYSYWNGSGIHPDHPSLGLYGWSGRRRQSLGFHGTMQKKAKQKLVKRECRHNNKTDCNKAGIIAIAVAAVSGIRTKDLHIAPIQSGGISNWQAVTRANTLASISSIFNRKPRG